MSKVYITGDCHGDFSKFTKANFPEQKYLVREDIVIILGDFGLWQDTPQERYKLNVLNNRNFTTVFVDGNHENYDRLYSNEFPIVDFHGGKAHKIRENIYHLMRGYIFDFAGKKFFCMGGASSHDISDGILDMSDFENEYEFAQEYKKMYYQNKMFRVNHVSWWKQELPDAEEMKRGKNNLEAVGGKVDYVITHCLPTGIASEIGWMDKDSLMDYFQDLILDYNLTFTKWYCGHYHVNRNYGIFEILYENIERLI